MLGMFGFTCAYAIRFNLSVAIVCMVKNDVINVTSDDGNVAFYKNDTDNDLLEEDTACSAQYAISQDWVSSSFI
jgi:hypothetical protein